MRWFSEIRWRCVLVGRRGPCSLLTSWKTLDMFEVLRERYLDWGIRQTGTMYAIPASIWVVLQVLLQAPSCVKVPQTARAIGRLDVRSFIRHDLVLLVGMGCTSLLGAK